MSDEPIDWAAWLERELGWKPDPWQLVWFESVMGRTVDALRRAGPPDDGLG